MSDLNDEIELGDRLIVDETELAVLDSRQLISLFYSKLPFNFTHRFPPPCTSCSWKRDEWLYFFCNIYNFFIIRIALLDAALRHTSPGRPTSLLSLSVGLPSCRFCLS